MKLGSTVLEAMILMRTLNNLVENNELPDSRSHGSAA